MEEISSQLDDILAQLFWVSLVFKMIFSFIVISIVFGICKSIKKN